MKLKRILIAAPGSGSGKTTVTCAILQALKEMGEPVISYKCGPDYIDPMFHQQILEVPSKNLDTFFTDEEETRELFLHGRTGGELALMEGVMGLYDGLGGVREEGSSYHLAKVTKTPILLVIDAKGMGRSILPLIAGFLAYDTEHLIKGVLLNRMSKGYYEIVKPLIESELHIMVVGYLPEMKEMELKSRHLGLLMPEEITGLQEQIRQLAEKAADTISFQQIIEIAGTAADLETEKNSLNLSRRKEWKDRPVIAVAKDEAFCFYYEDNLRMLEEYGAELRFFSPLHDEQLPEQCHGLLLGGGYPELYAEMLSKNVSMRHAIKTAIQGAMPVVAECGGFMYLHSSITTQEGIGYDMVGALEGRCTYQGKLVRFGYIEIEDKTHTFLTKNTCIRGHEFHYFDSTNNGKDCIATKPTTGKRYACMTIRETMCVGFPHLYYPANPEFAETFVEKVRKYQKKEGNI